MNLGSQTLERMEWLARKFSPKSSVAVAKSLE